MKKQTNKQAEQFGISAQLYFNAALMAEWILCDLKQRKSMPGRAGVFRMCFRHQTVVRFRAPWKVQWWCGRVVHTEVHGGCVYMHLEKFELFPFARLFACMLKSGIGAAEVQLLLGFPPSKETLSSSQAVLRGSVWTRNKYIEEASDLNKSFFLFFFCSGLRSRLTARRPWVRFH